MSPFPSFVEKAYQYGWLFILLVYSLMISHSISLAILLSFFYDVFVVDFALAMN